MGQILATTPLPKALYTLGKWLSNAAVLTVMTGTLALVALATQLIRGEDRHIELGKLLAPFLWLALPPLVLVGAVALLFETMPWLRGGWGNVAYLILYIGLMETMLRVDLFGYNTIWSHMEKAAQAAFPAQEISGNFGVNQVFGQLHLFRWEGMLWSGEIIGRRLLWIGPALAIALLAALLFDRFDPTGGIFHRLNFSFRWAQSLARRWKKSPPDSARLTSAPPDSIIPLSRQVSLAPLMPRAKRFRFGQMLLAELRLMLKGQPWWWYTVVLGLVVATLVTPLETTRRQIFPLAWIWPLLLWSEMGVRERRLRTAELVFPTPYTLRRQLPAIWLAGLIVTALAGSGMAVRLALAGDWGSVFAWAVGVAFIPALALALGCWSGSSRLFEVVYTILWYFGPMGGLVILDYMGALRGGSQASCQVTPPQLGYSQPLTYLLCTVALLGLAIIGRRRGIQV